MQTLGQKVATLLDKTISTSSTPLNEEEISEFLKDGIRDFTLRALASQNPNILSMLTTTKTDVGGGISIDNGFLVSVVRNEAAASTTLNPASVIDASLRGRAADVNSLLYQSHYNPVYYILNGVVNTLPTPTSSTDYAEVSYVSSEAAVNGTNYASVEISNFPKTFNGLIVYYAAAMACLTYASDISVGMPTLSITEPTALSFDDVPVFEGGSIPTFSVTFTETLPVAPSNVPIATPTITLPSAPSTPTITMPAVPVSPADLTLPSEVGNITLPSTPIFSPPTLSYSLNDVNTQIANEDMDLVEKQFEKIDKNFSKFEKDIENAKQQYTEELDAFNKEFERRKDNNDRTIQGEFTVYRENLNKYEKDIGRYQGEISSVVAEIQKFTAELNKFDKESALYVAQIQKYTADVNKYEKESAIDISLFTQELGLYNAALAKYQADLASFQTEFKSYESKLAKYQADIGIYQIKAQAELGSHQADISIFQSEVQEYEVKANGQNIEYQQHIQRYQFLYNQYLSGLTQAQPAQQQAEA